MKTAAAPDSVFGSSAAAALAEQPDAEIPEPGIHRIAAADYHRIDLCSKHRLDLLSRSPAHCREDIDNPKPSTPAMILGDALHAFVLEPDRFTDEYAILPYGLDRRTKEGKLYCSQIADKHAITFEEGKQITAMRESVMAHPAARMLIDRMDEPEQTFIWHDKSSGVKCKARLDMPLPNIQTIVDLKSGIDANRSAFERAIFQFGYHRQAAMYIDAGNTLAGGIAYEHFVIIAVEKEPPYAVAVYRLRDDVVSAGYLQVRPLIERYGQCQAAGRWPAYSPDVEDIALPRWAWQQMNIEEGTLL